MTINSVLWQMTHNAKQHCWQQVNTHNKIKENTINSNMRQELSQQQHHLKMVAAQCSTIEHSTMQHHQWWQWPQQWKATFKQWEFEAVQEAGNSWVMATACFGVVGQSWWHLDGSCCHGMLSSDNHCYGKLAAQIFWKATISWSCGSDIRSVSISFRQQQLTQYWQQHYDSDKQQ